MNNLLLPHFTTIKSYLRIQGTVD